MNLRNYFSNILKDNQILSDKDKMIDYETDESGIRFSHPSVVLFPENTDQVSSILKVCYANNFIIIPRGAGTGLSGGAIPLKPSVIVSSDRLNKIIEIDEQNLMVIVQPGIITGEMQTAVEAKGLFYPPDPASLENCTIGGNVAEISGGPRAVKYGTTRDYVRGLEIVTPNGDIMRFGGKIKKDATGYNIKDLIIGSEGTLCFITEITLSLLPKPKYESDLLIPFNSMKDAALAVSQIIINRIIPATIEFMEERALEVAYKMLGNLMTVKEGKAHLLIRVDGQMKEQIEKDTESIGNICMQNNAIDVYIADSKPFKDNLWKARRALHDAVVEMSIQMEREDVVVPPSKLPELIDKIKLLEQQFKIMIIVFGHAGDGNVHINIMKTKENSEYFDKHLKELTDNIMQTAVNLGGKLSGEHGIGIYKKQYMSKVFSDAQLILMRNIKKSFDPKNLFNPNKILP